MILTILTLLFATELALALPAPSRPPTQAFGTSIKLRRGLSGKARRAPQTTAEIHASLRAQADALKSKYGVSTSGRRNLKRDPSGASVQLQDINQDFTYFGDIQVGTPAKSYPVIFDTGSSDLWLASTSCTTGCDGLAPAQAYDPTASSTHNSLNRQLSVSYGSGSAIGDTVTETVSVAGFTVQNQVMGVMNSIGANLLHSGTMTGLMGLAWTALGQTQADPWWLTSVKAGGWSTPSFAFHLARDVGNQTETKQGPGGSVDFGFIDNTKFTGNITYTNLTSQNFWLIPLDGMTINGNSTTPGGQAAIDTGTSLIGGPSGLMDSLYAQIPGAQKGNGTLEGFYTYPCSSQANVALTFGGVTYNISSADFTRAADTVGQLCLGSFFPLDLGNQPVQWIVGDSFLKNVYSVFRFDPPSVGFAPIAPVIVDASAVSSPSANQQQVNGTSDGTSGSSTSGVVTPTQTTTVTAPTSTPSNAASPGLWAGSLIGYRSVLIACVSVLGAVWTGSGSLF